MPKGNEKAELHLEGIYQRWMGSRADEITMLKAGRLARQLREKEEDFRRLSDQRRLIQMRFKKFITVCMRDSMQQAGRMK